MEIAGHLALVTGGGSGLGAATARHLAARGAEVAILDFDIERAHQVAGEIGAQAYQVDVGDAQAVGEAVAQAVAQARGHLRMAVNCAGIANAARVVGRDGTPSTALFERVIRVNLIGSFNVMAHAAAEMRKLDALDGGERGVVVNTSSAAWQDGQVGQAAYAASKGGIAAMSLPVARDLARDGIRCMAIAPGLFRTPMMEALPEETTAAITANIPFPARLGDPAEFALMVAQIIENPYLNGTTIRLDGATRLPAR
ncbi:NAD(P)-dependent dehydrogenase (short-subunit alcohol dehydrogenase family) [Roseinatronobacter thiooxidans]|uniref:NAD(P)-dependent dehydrogenase (Short-subunit alcohol dehydrogenase family) n=1 Tax=Roseinatronobacter thiooxidans TaxID=121821 RepID=A0A2W7QPJ0_9RHOB|nr:SDR family NAD(P)-dependent oxidoreductase [Roseinatronobacter thiooxidans]PZX45787.1 NAD(P)-dependent dehydrogenase (short-subunit alcohol dehydrogenase family) [Roseinatronobacter thiooxidans]